MRIAVFASGNGSNFQAIAEALADQKSNGEITLLFCDKKEAYALERANKLNIPSQAFSPKDFASKGIYEAEILHLMEEYKIELIVLAGYMRLVGPTLLEAYPNKIINIHPSLLPAFPGLHGIRDAYEAGVKETGVTIHFVDKGVDTGPVIAQKKVEIAADDTLASLEEKIHQVEHNLYPAVLADIINKKERKNG